MTKMGKRTTREAHLSENAEVTSTGHDGTVVSVAPRRFLRFLLLVLSFSIAVQGFTQLSGYNYRKSITINSDQVGGNADLTNFPLLVHITDTDLRDHVNSANGFDIAFTSDDGVTQLDHELEKYVSGTGELVVWVRMQSLDHNDDTRIFMYYDNIAISSDQSSTGTWASDYESVWHLDESSSGGAGDFKDATSNGNDLTGSGGLAANTPTQSGSGRVANAQSFDGTDGLLATGYKGVLGTTSRTVSAWLQTSTNFDAFLGYGLNGSLDGYKWQLRTNTSGQVALEPQGVDHTSPTAITDGGWHYVVVTLDNDGTPNLNETNIYIDGSPANGTPGSVDINTQSGSDVRIGFALNGGANWVGLIDEVRLSKVAKTAGWIETEFNNQNDPSSFYTLGNEQGVWGPGGVPSNLVLWLKANAGVTGSSPVTGWADQSDEGNDASGQNSPALVASDLNYNPGIQFVSGDNDHFTLDPTLLPQGNSTRTYFVVSTAGASGNQQATFSHGNNATSERVALYHSTDTVAVRMNGGAKVYTVSIPSLLAMHVYDGGTVNDGFRVHLNGQEQSTGSGGITLNTTTNAAYVGLNVTGAQPYNGKLHEIIAYDRDLTSTSSDVEKIQSYLAVKYGITLDNSMGNYLASDGTTIWDATANSAYHNDVAGIGRDDIPELDQQKSLSINGDGMVIIDKGGSFPSDLSYIVWGNDDGPVSFAVTDKDPDHINRMERVWKTAVTGDPGVVTIQFVLTGNSEDALRYSLHVDADGTFAAGANNYTASSISGDTITFEDVSLSDGDFFTIGEIDRAPGGVTSNLLLWLRSDIGTSTTTDGGNVSSWLDQSGEGNDVTQTGAARPTYRDNSTDALNFAPVLEFDGATDFMSTSATDLLLNPDGHYTKLAVAVSNDMTVERTIIGGSDTNPHVMRINASQKLAINHANLQVRQSSNTVQVDEPFTSIVRYNPSGFHAVRLNGQNFTGTTDIAFADGALDIGAHRAGAASASDFWNGYMSEVIAYNTALATSDLRKIETYFAIKYGIHTDISASDYEASDGSIIWSTTDNAAYHNDVTGIGRDDISALDQRKSISASTDAAVIIDRGGRFEADKTFVVWGNDDGAVSMTATDKHPNYDTRLERVWKAAVTGNPGNVTVQFVLPGNSGAAILYALHVDDDGTFATGATNYPATSVDGDLITIENVSLSDGDYFTLGERNRAPGGVSSNLKLWLRSDKGTSTTTDGGSVASWADQSGEENNASQGTSGAQPTFRDNGNDNINFHPVLEFDGIDDIISTTATDIVLGSGVYSKFAVVNLDEVAGSQAFISGSSSGGHQFRTNGLGEGIIRHNNLTLHKTTARMGANETYIAYADYGTGGAMDVRLNGTESNVTNPETLIDGALDIGAARNGGTGSSFLDARLTEAIVYDVDLDDTDTRKVESYLAMKYGVTTDASAGNYVASDGTVVWDPTTNSAYHNDVAGIARDELSGLDLRKSVGTGNDAMVVMDKGGILPNDMDFLFWGHDGGDAALSTDDKPPFYEHRLERQWRVDLTGTPGSVSVGIIYPNDGDPTHYALHLDTDGTFASGALTTIASSIDGDTITFNNITFNDGDYFTLGFLSPAPGGIITDLSLWLKADHRVKNGSDYITSGTTDGWENSAENASFTEFPNVTGTPIVVTSQSNYNPAILFDGVDDQFFHNALDADVLFADQDNTTVVVFAPEDLESNTDVYMGWISAGTGERFIYFERTGTNIRTDQFNDNIAGSIDVVDQGYSIVRAYSDGTERQLSVNGEEDLAETPAMSFTAAGNTGQFNLGTGANASNPAKSHIAEVIQYKSALNAADLNKVESYLANKYGIVLKTSAGADASMTSSNDAEIWDGAAGYNNDVITLGRDDFSALDQKQAHTKDDSLRIFVGSLAADNVSNTGTISNEISHIVVGHNGERLMAHVPQEAPDGIKSRFNRVWKVTNTNFTDDFTMEIEWEEEGPFDIADIRFLVDDDGDFSDASFFADGDNGLTIESGSIVVGGISTLHIPMNSTRYVTIGSSTFGTTLPVELLSFQAEADEQGNVTNVMWSTASENNNDFFTIERSGDGTSWKEVLMVPGAGNSQHDIHYYETDRNPLMGLSYYRLKQTDFDGQFKYSHMVSVLFGDYDGTMTARPNPARDYVIVLGDPENLQVLRVINVLGQDVSDKIKVRSVGFTEKKLDISRLPKGLYTILTLSRPLKLIKD